MPANRLPRAPRVVHNGRMQTEGWNVIDERAGILWREYAFTEGAYATTLAFRGDEGMIVLSPGNGLGPRAYDALAEFGPVRALVATNAAHHLGQHGWRERFPDARSYAPAGALAKLARKVPAVPFAPLSELSLPAHARWQEAPGFKTGETLMSVDSTRGPVWFTGDLLVNMSRLPPRPLRWLFTWTGSAPGFRLFRLATMAFVRDRGAVRAWALARIDAHPPAIVVPGHGPAYDAEDVAEQARAQLQRL